MANISAYLQAAFLNHVFRGIPMSSPAAVYASLYNGDPESGGSEVTTTVRVAGRVAITFGAPSSGTSANSADVDFGNAAGAATVTYVGIHDAASSGNLLDKYATGTVSIGIGSAVKFVTGALSVTLA